MNITLSENKACVIGKNMNMSFEKISDSIIHCTYSKEETEPFESMIIDKSVIGYKPEIKEEAEAFITLTAGKLSVRLDKESGRLTWLAPENRVLLKEGIKEFISVPVVKYTTGGEAPVIERVKTVDGERNFIKNLKEETDHNAYQGRLYFEFAEDEAIHGLGQAEDGVYNYRNHSQYLYQHNMRIPMPMFVSTKGYGILFDATSLMTFNDNEAGSYMYFDAIPYLSYYVIAGDRLDDIIAGFRYLTGAAAMLPKWAYGYVQSKEQYYSANELCDVVRKYRELGVPLDVVVQDWNSWEKDQWGQKSLDPERYYNMKEKSDEIHAMGAHTMISVWPNMNTGTANYTEFLEKGFMLNDLATYNAFDENARELFWKQAKEGLFDKGFDSWWCDSTEPFSGPDWGGEIKREPWKRFELVGTEHKKYLDAEKANAFALVHAKGMYENQRKDTKKGRVLNLTRSGYASGQKYGAILWSGDITASFSVMKKQIAEGLNMAMSGYPYWTLDIGGFFTVGEKWQNRGCSCNTDSTMKWFWRGAFDEGVKDKGYCELYTRWIQFGAFLPMFRSHGTDTPREIWNFGEKGTMFYDVIEKYINLRYKLMPYIYSCAGGIVHHNKTMMRSLLFDFAEDKTAASIDTEYMFGDSLLICPVTKPMYYEAGSREINEEKTWTVYLPECEGWFDYHTGKKYEGGQYVTVASPLEIMPIFVKVGSIIPMKSGLQYAMEKNDSPLEIHIYSGADASFTLYDDAGDDYSYEKGEFSEIVFSYSEEERSFTAGRREGCFEGMDEAVRMQIILDGELKTEIMYSGEEIILAL